MSEHSEDEELAAIRSVVSALEMLSADVRARVLRYVFDRLEIRIEESAPHTALNPESPARTPISPPLESRTEAARQLDVRSLRDEKIPRSSTEMAALVAYYLSEVAQGEEHKDSVTSADVKRYFKQANYMLPQAINMVLPHAAAAGYFDAVGQGRYRLNPVGYNLVVHGMPSGASGERKGKSPNTSKTSKRTGKKRG
jgi:hypothetical protein